jgi:hypothetical protein
MTNINIKQRIDELNCKTQVTQAGDYCCYLCDHVIDDLDFKTISFGRYELDNGISYLVCGVHCERLPEMYKSRCGQCTAVIDVGFRPREGICNECVNVTKTCCYYCGAGIDDIDHAHTIVDAKDNVKNLVCSVNCSGIGHL